MIKTLSKWLQKLKDLQYTSLSCWILRVPKLKEKEATIFLPDSQSWNVRQVLRNNTVDMRKPNWPIAHPYYNRQTQKRKNSNALQQKKQTSLHREARTQVSKWIDCLRLELQGRLCLHCILLRYFRDEREVILIPSRHSTYVAIVRTFVLLYT